ncbi:Stress-activated map kinase-interacting protein 1 [Tolypocladium capitatum]|uniref:Stress-activated map kinase-interacting protein 1 n=1 Tax=Tolypocladium capitatum TaxID=45235 RepID=A0A2K3QB15_9HYPO|nr:Stress-activated map kinase-interacting protein 1 [Tolypocladium capitatum]
MSVIQLDELVSYQLRTSYLNEIADGVGERLLTVNDGFLNSAPFKAAGWRPDSSHTKRTHSPPIPTAIASEYFQAPRQVGLTLEDGEEDGGMLTGGGADTMGPGMATKRRRRREQIEEDDSSDLSDESDDENEQRAARQIKFAKMPVRQRAGSSPIQASQLQQQQQTSPRTPRRGSQSALETVRERRPRRDTVTSSEISSENELDVPAAHRHREAARAAARAMRLQEKINEEPTPGHHKRADTTMLAEEEDDDSDEASDISGDYVGSIDSASILDGVENPMSTSPTQPVVGTPPRNFTRQSTIRKSHAPTKPMVLEALPPPRPMSTIRPLSVVQPQSLLSAALKAKRHKSSVPFQKFAHFSGQGTQGSINVRIYTPFSKAPGKSFEVLIRPRVQDGQGAERVVTVADLIGLSLYRYNEEKREPHVPPKKFNINWWTLRMVEEGGEVDDDFPPFERTKPLSAFATVNNAGARGGGRQRSNSKAYDDFALVPATEEEFEENKALTPQEDGGEEEEQQQSSQLAMPTGGRDDDITPRNTPGPPSHSLVSDRPRQNPIVTTTHRSNTPLADAPQAPVAAPNTARGQQKLLRIHIMSADVAPGQMVTVDVTTDTYLAEVLDLVCRKRQLDKANHVLKLPGSGAVVMIDRPVSSIGNVSDLELYRRRFATDGPLSMTGSPSSASPKMVPLSDSQGMAHRRAHRKGQMLGPHPLARETLKQDELGNANYKKYTVWRKQPMRIVGMSERILVIDGEYIHIVPASGGKAVHDGGGKTTTVHFSNVIGCKVPRKHPTNVKLVIYKATESKRYDFECRGADEAAEIVAELKRGISPYREV